MRLQNDSMSALSKQLPTAPIDGHEARVERTASKRRRDELRALIGVSDGAAWPVSLDRHAQGVRNKGGRRRGIDRPADDPPGEDVEETAQ